MFKKTFVSEARSHYTKIPVLGMKYLPLGAIGHGGSMDTPNQYRLLSLFLIAQQDAEKHPHLPP